jgi:RNA polymerase sigma-70 factor (ECF subfamily)
MWDSEDDRTLLDGIRADDEEALTTFDRRFRKRLLSIARRRGLSMQDAEDAVQDTLLAAIMQIRGGRFENRASLATWVGSIFRNHVNSHFRDDGRRARAFVSLDAPASTDALAKRLDDVLATPDDALRLDVQDALAGLPVRERLVLLLNLRLGLPTREIAPMLRLGVKLTEAILTSAKKNFRERLGRRKSPPQGD